VPNAVRKPSAARQERHAAVKDRALEAAWQLAREQGLAGFTLKELGARLGMRAPSLFVYFDGKNALYDAMFAQAWRDLVATRTSLDLPPVDDPRARTRAVVRAYCDFFLSDPVRFQLMNQDVVPGFRPSEASYAAAVADLAAAVDEVRQIGVADPEAAVDLLSAMVAGLVSQQIANEPGGTRWAARAEEVADMWCRHHGIGDDA
jgi:AcrR family transcriptional regulator